MYSIFVVTILNINSHNNKLIYLEKNHNQTLPKNNEVASTANVMVASPLGASCNLNSSIIAALVSMYFRVCQTA